MSSTSSFTGLDSQTSLRARDTGSTERNKKGAGEDLPGLSGSLGCQVYRFMEEIQEQSKLGRLPCIQGYLLSREPGKKTHVVPSLYVRAISLDKKAGLDTVGISI